MGVGVLEKPSFGKRASQLRVRFADAEQLALAHRARNAVDLFYPLRVGRMAQLKLVVAAIGAAYSERT